MAAWHDRDVNAGPFVLAVILAAAAGLVALVAWRLWTEVLAGLAL